MSPRLGVNIDHVATLRQARGEHYPSIVQAAQVCLEAGADQITIHLREDRRHIQDTDVETVMLVTKKFGRPLNLEMGCNGKIIDIAIATAPEWVCLVPENRQERTTEGGLDLAQKPVFQSVKDACKKLKNANPAQKISLFLEANLETLNLAADTGADAVEIHTGDYAKTFLNGENTSAFLEQFELAQKKLLQLKLACHAGHGLTAESVRPLLKSGLFAEYNIGHWIIGQAVFDGLYNVVHAMKQDFNQY